MSNSDWCSECGNTGIIFETGERCVCKRGEGSVFENESVCLCVPEQYRNVRFSSALLPSSLGAHYIRFMDDLHRDVINYKWKNRNLFLSSPPQTGKKILAYSALEALYRKGTKIFPLYDVMEIRRIMQDLDYNKSIPELVEMDIEPSSLYTVPYLFVEMPTEVGFAVFDTLNTLLGRRLRRNGDTFVLSELSWKYIAEADKKGSFAKLVGDGSFGTLENKTFL